jgi:hypothetical protein
MRPFSLMLAAALTALTPGCALETFGQADTQVGTAIQIDGKGRAFVAGNVAVAAQLALYHVLAGFVQASAADLGEAHPLAALGTVDPDGKGEYLVKLGASTGSVKAQRDGRGSVDLSFAFTRSDDTRGFRYVVTDVQGKVEGFDLALTPLTIDFLRGEEEHWNLKVNAGGQLDYRGEVMGTLKTADFDLAWPAPAAGTRIGSLVLEVPGQQAVFTGEAFVGDQAVTTRAVVALDGGEEDYKLDLNGLGRLQIEAR